jgi:uncharacterized protein involved in outer membrane biogenesis
MSIIKKILVAVGVLLVLVVAAAIIIPIVFKDDIKAAIDKEIAKSVNADVIFDVDNFSLTVFKNFPNITVQVRELGVFNREPFEGVPLFVMERLDVEINLKEILFGNQIRVKGISLVEPQITIRVLKDGQANYNITYPSTDTVTVDTTASAAFSFGIDHWEIVDGMVTYDDQSLPYFLSIKGLNHSGRGDFNEKAFDLTTKTAIDTLTTSFDGLELLTNKRIELDAAIGISEEYTLYTFKENQLRINDFTMHADGWFKMNESDFAMDITYGAPDTQFKSLLSLVPGMYTKDFGAIKTKGELAFSGLVKGTFSDTQMPTFRLALQVNDAMFQYPDLPAAVTNINVDLLVDNATGVIEQTVVDLKKLHLDFGTNPVDARLRIENLKDYRMDALVAARLNLAELNKMFPMEGLDMRGNFSMNAKAKGVYDSIKKIIPAVDVTMTLADGYAKSAEFPLPLENLHMEASVKNESGKMAETLITVSDFSMLMDGETFTSSLTLQNLDDYQWDVRANGGIDLEKMTKIFPLEGMTLAGKVKADIQTKGKMSDLTAERYDRLPTSGTASLRDFNFAMKDLPYAITVAQSEAQFDPRKIDLKNTSGTIGKSDYTVSGSVSNYIGYLFGQNETIKGNMSFQSNLLDLNEFMTETEETTTPEDTTSFGVIPIPENIDFMLRSSIQTVKMMDYTMTNVAGDVILKDGVANLSGLKFNMLGGAFVVNGSYNAKDIAHPRYDMSLSIQDLSIQQAATSFSIVKSYAPIAGLVNGNFGTDFKISGELTPDMMPNLATVNGAGLIKIAQAALTQSKLVAGVTAITKLNDTDQVTMKDVLMSAAIENGRLSVKPFDVKFGSYATTVSGSSGVDGSLDYQLKMNVPPGKLGTEFSGLVSQYTGSQASVKEIPLTIGVGGTFADPKTRLLMADQKTQAKEAVKQEVVAATQEVKQEVKQEATKAVEEKKQQVVEDLTKGTAPKDVVNNLLKPKSDSTKKDSVAKPVQQQLQNKLNTLLKKKKND